jgi:hypothetical protein
VSLQTIMGGIASALTPLQSQIDGLQVHAGWIETPTPPQIDIYPPPGVFLLAGGFGATAKQANFTVRLRVALTDPPAAQALLLRMLDPTDPASVTVALEQTAFEPAEVTGFRQYGDDGDQRLLGCEWIVTTFL